MTSELETHFRAPREPLVGPGAVDLHARDMTATFAADVTLGDAQRKLADIGQWLPVDGPAEASLGGLVDVNSTGPLRLGYGAWRDLLLGCQFTNGRGELITAGGRTVKNVAGYDLTKFMVGQRGMFGKLVTLTTRTYRLPDGAVLARHRPDVSILSKLLPTDLRPQWAVLTPDALLCGYLGGPRTVEWYGANVGSTEPVGVFRRPFEADVQHRQELWDVLGDDRRVRFRASVPPSQIEGFAEQAGLAKWVADAAFGLVIGFAPSPEAVPRIRAAAERVGGSAVSHGDAAHAASVASTNPVERRIIERLKAAFDPEHKLSPLPWQVR